MLSHLNNSTYHHHLLLFIFLLHSFSTFIHVIHIKLSIYTSKKPHSLPLSFHVFRSILPLYVLKMNRMCWKVAMKTLYFLFIRILRCKTHSQKPFFCMFAVILSFSRISPSIFYHFLSFNNVDDDDKNVWMGEWGVTAEWVRDKLRTTKELILLALEFSYFFVNFVYVCVSLNDLWKRTLATEFNDP